MAAKNKTSTKKPAAPKATKAVKPEKSKRHETKAEVDAIRIAATKEALITSLKAHRGNVSNACDALSPSVSRDTFYEYKKKDPEFARKVNEIKEIVIDFVEDKMFQIIEGCGKGAPGLIIWYLKTQARHRGYVEHDVEDPEKANKVNINITFSKKKAELDESEEWERPSFDKDFIAENEPDEEDAAAEEKE